jgi:hypothetical protein
MNKKILVLLLFCPFVGKSQNQIKGSPTDFNRTTIFNIYYGTNQTLGINFLSGKEFVFGFDASVYLGEGGVGRDYTGTIGRATFANDIYETRISPYFSGSILAGKKITKNFMPYIKLGLGSTRKYYNGYDASQILDPSGYWFISEPSGNDAVLGVGFAYTIKRWAIVIGYDSFNAVNIGLGMGF